MSKSSNRGSVNIPRLMFYLSVSAALFVWGFATEKYRIFPHSILNHAIDSTRLVFEDFGARTKIHPGKQVLPSRRDGSGVFHHETERAFPGATLVTSFYDNEVAIRLLAMDGTVINHWAVLYHDIWQDEDTFMPQSERPVDNWHVMSNGIAALEDGSLVFPLGGLVRIDRCGELIWKIPHRFHHSVEISPRGTFWVPGRRYTDGKSPYKPFRAPYKIDTVAEVSADGKILREFPVLDLLWNDEFKGLLVANNRGFILNRARDIIHLNDIEEIPPEYLDQFPDFEAGDLMLSLRQNNMVMVVDPETREIKWYSTGPWIQQHDPDWQPDGTISVFDNAFDKSPYGSALGGSNIISIDPKTNDFRFLYGKGEDEHFYTAVQGDHQILPNGNILITESNAGRVFEVSPTGRIVWDYINRYSETEVFRIRDATRYPEGYFQVDDWSCS